MAVETATVQVAVECPPGHWCSAALKIACSTGTYNNRTDQISAGACTAWPKMSESPEASISIAACVCSEGWYDNATEPDRVLCLEQILHPGRPGVIATLCPFTDGGSLRDFL